MSKTQEPTKTFTFYENVNIDFYEKLGRKKHVYLKRETGERLISVTGATGIIDKPMLLPWACKEMAKDLIHKKDLGEELSDENILASKGAWRIKRDGAGDTGTRAHEVIQKYIEFKLKLISKMPAKPKDNEVENCFIAFKGWESQHKVEYIATEKMIFSKKYGFVGLLDILAIVDGVLSIVDIKTGNGVYGEAVYQVSGYGIAHTEETGEKIDQSWILRLGKNDAEFYAKPFKNTPLLNKGFLSCLFLKKNKEVVDQLIK